VTTAATSESAQIPLGSRPFGLGRGAVGAVATLGGLVAVAAGLLVATSGHLVHPVEYGLELAVLVAATTSVGLYWAVRRPGNRIAVVLLAYAACLTGISLQGASNPVLHSIGVLFDAPSFLLGYYLVFIFPNGRLTGVLEKLLLVGLFWDVFSSFLPWVFFSPYVSGAAPLAGCNDSCPTNGLMISNDPDIANGFGKSDETFNVVLAAAIVVVLCYRLAIASRPRRRALVPVYLPALLLSVPFGIFHAAGAGAITLDATAVDRIGWFVTSGRVLLTFGFAFAIWQATLFAGVALKKILGGLRREDDVVHLRGLVADALDDPTLEIALEVERGSGFFLDSRGDPIDPTQPRAGSSTTSIARPEQAAAYMLHDDVLDTDPELVQAAGRSVVLALESGRLESELRSRVAELRASRARIVAAGDAERRKMERDLHDGAQQHVLALMMKVGQARSAETDPVAGRQLDEIQAGLEELWLELRQLGHGVYPPVLAESGLGKALEDAAARSVPPALLRTEVTRRYPAEVEAAVYYCCLEALQNVSKHAGPDARASIRVWQQDDRVWFEVADDGRGQDPRRPLGHGQGIANMRERLSAVDGTLSIESSVDGTRVRGSVPVPPPDRPTSDRSRASGVLTARPVDN